MFSSPYSSSAIANEFIQLGMNENIELPHLKLQALLYYAQGWYLALKDKPLIEENICAYKWGPGIRNVYIQTHSYKNNSIVTLLHTLSCRIDRGTVHGFLTIPTNIQEEDKLFMKKIWDTHKNYSHIQLCNSTHAPNEPWSLINLYYGLEQEPTIPNSLIRDSFKQKIKVS